MHFAMKEAGSVAIARGTVCKPEVFSCQAVLVIVQLRGAFPEQERRTVSSSQASPVQALVVSSGM